MITFEDLMEFVLLHYSGAQVAKYLELEISEDFKSTSLYDENKKELLKDLSDNFSLEEIQEMSGWKPGQGFIK